MQPLYFTVQALYRGEAGVKLSALPTQGGGVAGPPKKKRSIELAIWNVIGKHLGHSQRLSDSLGLSEPRTTKSLISVTCSLRPHLLGFREPSVLMDLAVIAVKKKWVD